MMLPIRKYCVAAACWAPISAATSPAPTSNSTPQQHRVRQRRKWIEPGSPTALRDGKYFSFASCSPAGTLTVTCPDRTH
jgi:hypothetical protein